ncbi:tetratricopeptide repeat protein [Arcicella aquatica]|uniref:Tetratricopeptide repeat protein n=1 Tax=Arcicella aquatica TaxID=217141 RepID=A0ABU5QW37_9BACT|nr:tetratricopeptide repeat protein [Arcicella aquatica]MEA5260950.1 tetratricopeptide repeat protein [Arcicella aquatica]
MKKNRNISLYLLLIVCLVSACISESKKGINIPAVPEVTEKARRDAAIAFLTDAIDASPNSSENYYKRSLLYLENEKITEALEDVNTAISIKPNVGTYFQAKALILRASNQPKLALEAASKAEVLNAESPELYTLLGDLYQQLSMYDKAKAYLRKALQISPNNGETYFVQGEISAKMADTATALGYYQQTLSLKPSFLPVYLKLAQIHTNLREYDIALLYANKGLSFHPKNGNLYLQKGNTYQKSWKLDSAILCFNRAIQLDSSLVEASFNTGLIYFKSRAYRLALPFFERTFRHNPQYPEAKFFVAQCLEYTGNFELAETYYSELLAANSQDYRALNGVYRTQHKQKYGAYSSGVDAKFDTASYQNFEAPARKVDTTSIRPLKPKGILNN